MKIGDDHPPLAARLILWFVCDHSLREEILDDLLEEFLSRKERDGQNAAVNWYWRQVLHSTTSLSWFRIATSASPIALAAIFTGMAVAFLSAVGLGVAMRELIFGSQIPESELIFNLVSIICAGVSSVAASISASWLLGRLNLLATTAMGTFVLAPHFLLKNHPFDEPSLMIGLTVITVAGLVVGEKLAGIWRTHISERI